MGLANLRARPTVGASEESSMHRLLFCCLLVANVLFASPSAAAVAVSADDVCAPTSDPCVVTRPIEVEAGSHLDFGLRTLRIEGAGLLDFTGGRGAVSCGRLETATAGPAIRSRALSSPAATLAVEARKRCSGAVRPCLADADCEGAGTCSQGDGVIELRGGIAGNAEAPGHIVLRSAGDLAVLAAVSLAGTRSESDGGSLALESSQGDVVLDGPIDASGGGGGCGGDVAVVAAGDVAVRAPIDASGGEYDGGSVSLEAGGDVTIAADIAVDAKSGAGAGGEIDVLAGHDIVALPATDSGVVVLSADGHQSVEYEGGDGGAVSFEADGSIRIARDVRVAASAAAPDGFGDSLSFAAELDLDFDGTVIAKGRGTGGAGALVDLYAGRDVRIGGDAVFELTGSAAGGDLMVEAAGAFSSDGTVDVSGGAAGLGGRIVTVSGGNSRIGGRWTTAGAASDFTIGEVFVEGCRVRVDASIANAATEGRNRFVAHDALSVGGQASIVANGAGATNTFTHRGTVDAPQMDGAVTPAPAVFVDPGLEPCPGCGDAAVDAGMRAATLRMRRGDAHGEDSMILRARLAGEVLPADPAAPKLRAIVSDSLSRPLLDVALADDAIGRERVRVRLDGLDLSEAAVASELQLTLLFGDGSATPEDATCLGSIRLECRSARRGAACVTPR
jgi:hypothetical protein